MSTAMRRLAGPHDEALAGAAAGRASRPPRLRLLLSAPDGAHAARAVRAVLRAHRADLVGMQRYTDPVSGWHHCRSELDPADEAVSAEAVRRTLVPLAAQQPLRVQLGSTHERRRVVVLVSKAGHCLSELFERQRAGGLDIDVACVISNHPDLGPVARAHGVPFHHVPMPGHDTPRLSAGPGAAGAAGGAERAAAFERVFDLFERHRGDVMVLARFMQILPPALCARAAGRILNIHHSLLPAFSGARAYHQAWAHGVKWIGATCHYVTAELDQGPIIEQDARRVDHAHSVDDLVQAGRDLERRVLCAGLRAHVEDRVVVCGSRTVVFGH